MEQAVARYLLQFALMFIIIKWLKLKLVQKETNMKLIARGLLGTLSILSTMHSLKLIAPSDTIALVNLNVVFVPLFAKVLLPNEKLSIYHYLAIPITFTGVILFAKPTFLFNSQAETKDSA